MRNISLAKECCMLVHSNLILQMIFPNWIRSQMASCENVIFTKLFSYVDAAQFSSYI